jgi:hypothetical protein
MARKEVSVKMLKRRRRRLLNCLEPLLQLDLFRGLDEDTIGTVAELKAGVAAVTCELDELERWRRTA